MFFLFLWQNGVKEDEAKPFYTAFARAAKQQRDKIAVIFCEGVDPNATHSNPSTGPSNCAASLAEKGKWSMNKSSKIFCCHSICSNIKINYRLLLSFRYCCVNNSLKDRVFKIERMLKIHLQSCFDCWDSGT